MKTQKFLITAVTFGGLFMFSSTVSAACPSTASDCYTKTGNGPFVYTANSCAYHEVNQSVKAAASGDTVIIPAGTCTWGTSELMTLSAGPTPSDWAPGATITGEESGASATILSKITNTTYSIINRSGTFKNTTGGEKITDGTNSRAGSTGYPIIESEFSVSTSGKALTIEGNGIGSTIIKEGRFSISTGTEISGIEFQVSSNSTMISPNGIDWRIHDCKFVSATFATGITIRGTQTVHPFGVIDNNYFQNVRVDVLGDADCGQTRAVDNTSDLNLGSDEAVYIENNTFNMTVFSNSIDGNDGNKTVYRFNDWVSTGEGSYPFEQHSIQGDANIATKKFEFYNNKANLTGSSWVPARMRGGTGVMFNNEIRGTSPGWTWCAFLLDNVRSYDYRGSSFGRCNGGSPVDGNQAAPNGTGTHTGENSNSVLIDSGKNWITNDFMYNPSNNTGQHILAESNATVLSDTTKTFPTGTGTLKGFWIQNTTDDSGGLIVSNTATTITVAALTGGIDNTWQQSDAYVITGGAYVYNLTDGSKGEIRSNTANTVIATLSGGTTNTWHTGDAYKITFGYPCRGQIGWGKDSGAFPYPYVATGNVYPTQEQVPVYAWGNTCGNNGQSSELKLVTLGSGLSGKQIIENRDYYNASSLADAKTKGLDADYEPYQCPHPLTGLAGTCNYAVTGKNGYPSSVEPGDTTPPSAPSGLNVS